MKTRKKRSFWILLTITLLPLLAFGVWYARKVNQQRLDYALIAAIKQNDTTTAVTLLNDGANANATDRPVKHLTMESLLSEIWNRIKGNAPAKDTMVYPSALLLPYWPDGPQASLFQPILLRHPRDNPELVHALLSHGANPYISDGDGFTLLHNAARLNHSATVRVLLEHHVDPNVKWKRENISSLRDHRAGMTPLMMAHYDCSRLLIEYGAEVNLRDNSQKTPLMWSRNLKKYQLLLDHEADINAQDETGMTALMMAVRYFYDAGMVCCLLQHGAKVSLRDKSGRTALNHAHIRGDPEILHLLEEAARKEQAAR